MCPYVFPKDFPCCRGMVSCFELSGTADIKDLAAVGANEFYRDPFAELDRFEDDMKSLVITAPIALLKRPRDILPDFLHLSPRPNVLILCKSHR